MPFKDPEKARAAKKKHREALSDEYKIQDHLLYQKKRLKRREQMEKINREAGAQARPKGPLSQPEIKVPKSRRWKWLAGRVYFSTLRGYKLDELEDIVQQLKAALATEEAAKKKQQSKA